MPLFISKQAERDYYTLRRTMDLAQFKNDRPLIDWCERYLALFRPVREIRQPRDYPMANPFRVHLEWFGIDEFRGYVVVAGCLFGSGGNGEDLEASFKRAIENKYALIR